MIERGTRLKSSIVSSCSTRTGTCRSTSSAWNATRKCESVSMTTLDMTPATARRVAIASALLASDEKRPKDDARAILRVVQHFGSLQIDPTRTIEKTHYLVLWSRI